jgi:hypothetical protein
MSAILASYETESFIISPSQSSVNSVQDVNMPVFSSTNTESRSEFSGCAFLCSHFFGNEAGFKNGACSKHL